MNNTTPEAANEMFPPPRVFKIGASVISEDAATAGKTNEQARNILRAVYPEVANATIREYTTSDHRVVEFMPQPGRKG